MYTAVLTQQMEQLDMSAQQCSNYYDDHQQPARYTMSFSAPTSLPAEQQFRQQACQEPPGSPFYRLPQQLRCFQHQRIEPSSSLDSSMSKRTILLLCAMLLLGMICHSSWNSRDPSSNSSSSFRSGMRLQQSVTDLKQQLNTLPSSTSSRSGSAAAATTPAAAAAVVVCPYGSLPGTWVSSAAAGARWQVLDPDCQLSNWLEIYSAAAAALNSSSSTADSSSRGSGGSSAPGQPPPVHMLLLSDSVDRFIIQHVCDHLGGSKQTHSMHPTAAAQAAEAAADQLRQQQQQQQQQQQRQQREPAPVAGRHNHPTALNKTAYAFHTCDSNAPLKLASSYFPGVHPTGPYHRFLAQNYTQRIDSAREMWIQYAGSGNEPEMVSVASLLWDIARIYMHEREKLEGLLFLDRDVLDGWIKNMIQVVKYAQQKFPKTRLWVTHTTMPPHHTITTGMMTKPYLGRRYFIHQLNAAAATVARKMGLQLVDYEAVAEPFLERQQHLVDLIHPNAVVGLEVFNLMLNLVIQQQQQQEQQGVAGPTPVAGNR